MWPFPLTGKVSPRFLKKNSRKGNTMKIEEATINYIKKT